MFVVRYVCVMLVGSYVYVLYMYVCGSVLRVLNVCVSYVDVCGCVCYVPECVLLVKYMPVMFVLSVVSYVCACHVCLWLCVAWLSVGVPVPACARAWLSASRFLLLLSAHHLRNGGGRPQPTEPQNQGESVCSLPLYLPSIPCHFYPAPLSLFFLSSPLYLGPCTLPLSPCSYTLPPYTLPLLPCLSYSPRYPAN